MNKSMKMLDILNDSKLIVFSRCHTMFLPFDTWRFSGFMISDKSYKSLNLLGLRYATNRPWTGI